MSSDDPLHSSVLIQNDAIVFGLLAATLAAIFYAEKHPSFRRFFDYVPTLLLCYFVPSFYTSLGLIDPETSRLYFVASRYLLPACLVLLCLSIDLPAIIKLGPKALILFLVGTFGIIIGGPIALAIVGYFQPQMLGGNAPDAVWRGLAALAGSWIGGGANMAAMEVLWRPPGDLFSRMVFIDLLFANLWMGVLLFMAKRAEVMDAKTGADVAAIEEIKLHVMEFERTHARIPTFHDLMYAIGVAFGVTGLAHATASVLGPWIAANFPVLEKMSLGSTFFWLIILATLGGILLSFTRVRNLEKIGTTKIGSVMLYFLVATIGMKLNIAAVFNAETLHIMLPLIAVGGIWISIHASLLLIFRKILNAPVFYMAVGSQANVGGAASAPVVAAAFHPSLAPVGVLLAVFGYGIGTFAAYLCAVLMQFVSGGL
ncbi:MAG: DUF819 family protein [Gammaproteobacteria bacterium]|nr:DUF819 family protein [Gammaproteobacteria bacterium]